MVIEFERSGGLAGMRLAATLDSASLTHGEAEQLQNLIEESGFFDLPARPVSGAGGSDRLWYRLAVEDAARRHSFEAGEADVPEALWPVLDWLSHYARTAR